MYDTDGVTGNRCCHDIRISDWWYGADTPPRCHAVIDWQWECGGDGREIDRGDSGGAEWRSGGAGLIIAERHTKIAPSRHCKDVL